MNENSSPDAAAFTSGPGIAAGPSHAHKPTDDAQKPIERAKVGQSAYCDDGRRGRVTRLLRDRGSRRVTHLVVRTRAFLGREAIVPSESVAKVEDNRVQLSIDSRALDRLPVYRTDEVIDGAVERALSRDDELHRSGRPLLTVSVRDGMVTLRGHVPDQRARTRAEAVANGTRGVLGLRDRLVADDYLETAVARALADDERTRQYVIRVHARQGVVLLTGTLEGTLASAETQVVAQEIAANVAGVRSASVQMPETSPDEVPPILPGVGLPVYATDGRLGQLELVVMEPLSRRVADLVVVGHFPSPWRPSSADSPLTMRSLVIAARSVSRVTDQAIFLSLDRATAGRSPDYHEDDFRVPEPSWHNSVDYRREDVRFAVVDRSALRRHSASTARAFVGTPRG